MLESGLNERLTRVSLGTPMGDLLARYWHPIGTTGELHDNPVKPVRLLGLDLTLFMDRKARLGLVAQRCAHRRVNLKWGIPPARTASGAPTTAGPTMRRVSAWTCRPSPRARSSPTR